MAEIKKPAATWQDRAIAATRGNQSQFGAILLAALDRKVESGPSFGRSAVITSDGFVMADFRDRTGAYHSGAFVCAVSDLADNADGLADHLKLTAAERAELRAVLQGWIATDYRARRGLFV